MSDPSPLIHHLSQSLQLVLWLSLPILGVAAAVGLIVGLLQAVTQIQDQSLPQVAKLVAVLVALAILAPTLGAPLLRQTERVLADFPAATR